MSLILGNPTVQKIVELKIQAGPESRGTQLRYVGDGTAQLWVWYEEPISPVDVMITIVCIIILIKY